jgi:hypothetical protein
VAEQDQNHHNNLVLHQQEQFYLLEQLNLHLLL